VEVRSTATEELPIYYLWVNLDDGVGCVENQCLQL